MIYKQFKVICWSIIIIKKTIQIYLLEYYNYRKQTIQSYLLEYYNYRKQTFQRFFWSIIKKLLCHFFKLKIYCTLTDSN